jgi:hypothetical protein
MLAMTEAAAIDAVKKAGFTPKVEYYAEEIGGMVGKVRKAPQPNWGRVLAQSVPAESRTAGPVVLTVGQK